MRPVPPWPEYFMLIAETIATRSKDPNTQVGAVIANTYNRIVSTGYNGMPPGFPETADSWEKPYKYTRVVHAEENAILHAGQDLRGCTIYVTLSPCRECAKTVISSGIKEVVYRDFRDANNDALEYFDQCGITYYQLDSHIKWRQS